MNVFCRRWCSRGIVLALAPVAALWGELALGQEGVQSAIHRSYQSPRALGMGGAFVAVADDYSAIFYNPAGLARLENAQFNGAIDLSISADQFASFAAQIDTASKIENDNDRFEAMVGILEKNYGKQFSFRASLFSGIFAAPNWSLAVIPADLSINMRVHNQGTPALNLRTYLDTTVAFGYGQAFRHMMIPGRFSWGITTKFVHRGFASKQVNSLDLASDAEVFKTSDLRDGYTYDFDWGLMFTPALPSDGFTSVFRWAKPTFGFVVRNILDTGFNSTINALNKEDTEPPEKLHRSVDFGTRFELPAFSIFSWRAVADVQDLMHPNYSLRKSLHFGAEFDWTVTSWWKGQYRLGVNQGYPTAGASFLLGFFRLDALTYGEDIGTTNSPRENRMYKLVFNLDI